MFHTKILLPFTLFLSLNNLPFNQLFDQLQFVFDSKAYEEGAFRFRVLEGVASGSSQFCYSHLQDVLKRINHPKVIIVDLRQEYHFFLNAPLCFPVALFDKAFLYNQHMNDSKTLLDKEAQISQEISQWPNVMVCHGYLPDDALGEKALRRYHRHIIEAQGKERPFCITEQELVNTYFKSQATYVRLPVLDHHFPHPEVLEALIKLVKAHPDHWFHFHCRGGRGRTTTFMILTDMIKNKGKYTFEQYLQRQTDMGGATDFRKPKYIKRYKQLESFYKRMTA